MKNLLLLFSFLVIISCGESDIEPSGQSGPSTTSEQQDIVTDASGRQYPFLDPKGVPYCGPAWGRKFCRFLRNHDETIWSDPDNYYSEFSDIRFSNFPTDANFISFFKVDSIASYCEGWKVGETTNDGIKWNIKIKRDQEDLLWFDYEYFGSSEEIEYTTNYKYQVIDGLLHFSSSDGQSFIYHPSERIYSQDFVETSEIIELEGCRFY